VSALLVVLALTACSESAEDKYRDEFPSINRELAVVAGDVAHGLRSAGGSDDRAIANEFRGYARRLGELRGRLEDLDSPNSLSEEHDRLLAAIAAVRTALGEVAGAAERADPAAAREAGIQLVQDGERMDEARRKLARGAREL
jgi:hypothetical protein